jgi:hypothetical protein
MSDSVTLGYSKVVALKGSVKTTYYGFDILSQFYEDCLQYTEETVLISLKNVSWIDGNLCALLYAYMYKLNKERGLQFVFSEHEIKPRFNILARNGFLGESFTLPDGYGTSIPLHTFGQKEDEKFDDFVNNRLLAHESLNLTDAQRESISDHFLEIFSNVQIHAQTDMPIFACGQYFPKNRRLHFTLLDLGIGYFQPIHQHTKGTIKNCQEAIDWAIKGNSTKGLHLPLTPGGLGLSNLHEYCINNRGALHIASGDAYMVYSPFLGNLSYTSRNFDGAFINIIFDC